MTIADRYQFRLTVVTDIYEHLPYLYDLGTRSARIIELGTRDGESTTAFLAGLEQSGGHLWSVDLDYPPNLPVADNEWTFHLGDDLDPEIVKQLPDDVDVVFIDTSHAYEHTLSELNVYRWKVRPGGKIVLHDTENAHPEGVKFVPRFPVKVAVEEFCREEGLRWSNRPNCWGLGTIEVT